MLERIFHPLNCADYNRSREAEQASNEVVALLSTGAFVVRVLACFALRFVRLTSYARLRPARQLLPLALNIVFPNPRSSS